MKQKTINSIIVRDKHGTLTNKIDAMIAKFKTANPENLEPDELDKINRSSFIRKVMNNQYEKYFG